MPKHIARLVVLMVAFGAAAYAAKVFFTADSFYRYGHYRGDSVAEIASDKPKFKGSDYCQTCHAERYAEWSAGVHHSVDVGKVVQCEVCHGAAGGRDIKGDVRARVHRRRSPGERQAPGADRHAQAVPALPRKDARQTGRAEADRHRHSCGNAAVHDVPQPALAEDDPWSSAAPDCTPAAAPAGKAAVCAGCHGGDGVSANPVWPNLAGQHDAYLVEALKAYKSGARDNAMMAAIAKALSDADMREIAAHFAALKCEDRERGRRRPGRGGRQGEGRGLRGLPRRERRQQQPGVAEPRRAAEGLSRRRAEGLSRRHAKERGDGRDGQGPERRRHGCARGLLLKRAFRLTRRADRRDIRLRSASPMTETRDKSADARRGFLRLLGGAVACAGAAAARQGRGAARPRRQLRAIVGRRLPPYRDTTGRSTAGRSGSMRPSASAACAASRRASARTTSSAMRIISAPGSSGTSTWKARKRRASTATATR